MDEYDWGNLNRLLKYLKGTKYTKLELGVDLLSVVIWWVDASHNTHVNFRGHTRIMMILGRGAVINPPPENKYNVKSSKEWDLVWAPDGLSVVLWRFFWFQNIRSEWSRGRGIWIMYHRKYLGWCARHAKARQGFREFIGELMNMGIYNNDGIERKRTSGRISGGTAIEENVLNTTTQNLS